MKSSYLKAGALSVLPLLLSTATPALANGTALKFDSGDTAWVMISTVLVLLMTIPGLALFYAGMVRKKNILATMMQAFAITCLMTLVWSLLGYSLAFTSGTGAWAPYIGDFSRLMLRGIETDFNNGFILAPGSRGAVTETIPENVFMMFQMTFAIITPAVIAGAFADRMKFSAMCIFMILWSILIYSPIAHWVWAPTGWLAQGAFGLPPVADFAGGNVVEINSGVAGLMSCLVLGKRTGYGTEAMAPYNLGYAVIGASLLWVGWLGFNAGSALTSGGRAGMAMTATQLAGAAAALGWMGAEWLTLGKPTVLGIISGAVAGLVAITPAAGFVLPNAAVAIGLIGGVGCFLAATRLKAFFGYDDSLDTFGVHGVGGIIGTLLTGVWAYGPLSAGINQGGLRQFWSQFIAMGATLAWSGIGSFVLLKIIDQTIGLRVSEEQERLGLDEALHGESLG